MPDRTKFSLTIGKSTQAMLTKRELAYQVFAEAVRRGVSPEQIQMAIAWRKPTAMARVEGYTKESEFIQKAQQASASKGKAFDPIRYYTANQRLIHVNDRTYAFTNQWGQSTITLVNQMIREMGATDIRFMPCT